ncbi:MAG: hypothetical protein KIC73_00465 [Clostridiales bacterium]|nr:hypothetical protein [Clostridiales bacterium]
MGNEVATVRNDISIFSDAEKWNLATKMATSLAQSTIVPKDFQNNANNTLIAIELANRLQTSPLAIMQNLYVVYGRPSWSAQYIIAMINGSGKYDMELQYDEKTDKDGKPFSCQCWTERHGRKVTGPIVDMDMAKAEDWLGKNGSKWKTMPQMMLRYRAASFFGRMNCPELTMGIYTKEEVVEIGPAEYYVQDVDDRVGADIGANANSVDFEEATEETSTQTTEGSSETAGTTTEKAKEPF